MKDKITSSSRDPELVRRIGVATALEVRATGIPYTFAPCIAVGQYCSLYHYLILDADSLELDKENWNRDIVLILCYASGLQRSKVGSLL